MKILITGGSGFLGSHLTRRHLDDGDEVVVLAKEATDIERDNAAGLRERGANVVVGDVVDTESARPALDGVELVYHIAAAMREANVSDDYFREVNVRATERLLAVCKELGVRRFLYCGTSGAVGPAHGRKTDEETECHPKDIYQITKLEAERLVLAFQREHDYPVSVVRPAGVYGPGDERLLKLFRMIQRRKFMMIGSGRGKHHLIYIDDLVDGMRLAATKPEAIGRCYNLADERPVPLNELVAEAARQLDAPPPKFRLPFGPMKALSAVVEFGCRPFGIQPPLYRRRLDFFAHDEHFDISRAKSELGFAPQFSLTDGIAQTINAYRAAGWLN